MNPKKRPKKENPLVTLQGEFLGECKTCGLKWTTTAAEMRAGHHYKYHNHTVTVTIKNYFKKHESNPDLPTYDIDGNEIAPINEQMKQITKELSECKHTNTKIVVSPDQAFESEQCLTCGNHAKRRAHQHYIVQTPDYDTTGMVKCELCSYEVHE